MIDNAEGVMVGPFCRSFVTQWGFTIKKMVTTSFIWYLYRIAIIVFAPCDMVKAKKLQNNLMEGLSCSK